MSDSDRKPRILIVEDHPLIAELVETRLRIEGMQAIKCTSGREALEVVGRELLRHIRSRSTTATLPVIFLTAKSTPADIEKGLAMGANYYITKPFSGLDLVRKVRLCLGEHAVSSQPPVVG